MTALFHHAYSIYPDFSVNSALHVTQCGNEVCAPNHYFGPISRDHHLLHFVTEGKGTLEMNNIKYNICAGHGFYIPTGIHAKYTADNEEPWTYSWLGFDGTDSVSALSFRNLSARFPIFSFSLEENVSAMMDELLPIYSADGNDFSVISYLYRFFSLINPDFKLDHEKNASFEHMITYIKDNFQSDISIVKMADCFNISTSQLFRDFKKYSSMSPQQYIKQYRVFYAAHLLSTTDLTISQISTLSGYNDICNFSKQFKSIYNRSPADYRKYISVHSNVVWKFEHSPGSNE